jgi:hypothetical protein
MMCAVGTVGSRKFSINERQWHHHHHPIKSSASSPFVSQLLLLYSFHFIRIAMSRRVAVLATRTLRSSASISAQSPFQIFASSRSFTIYRCRNKVLLHPAHDIRHSSTATALATAPDDDFPQDQDPISSEQSMSAEVSLLGPAVQPSVQQPDLSAGIPELSPEDAALFGSGPQEAMAKQVKWWKKGRSIEALVPKETARPRNTRLKGARKARREAEAREFMKEVEQGNMTGEASERDIVSKAEESDVTAENGQGSFVREPGERNIIGEILQDVDEADMRSFNEAVQDLDVEDELDVNAMSSGAPTLKVQAPASKSKRELKKEKRAIARANIRALEETDPTTKPTKPLRFKKASPSRQPDTQETDPYHDMIKQASAEAREKEEERRLFLIQQRERAALHLPDPPLPSETTTKTDNSLPEKLDDFKSPYFASHTESSHSRPSPSPLHTPQLSARPLKRQLPADAEEWRIHKEAIKAKHGDGPWNPLRKLSPDAQIGIRELHASNPDLYTTPVLANHFKVSPEAIRRILKSRWMDSLKTEAISTFDKDNRGASLMDTPIMKSTSGDKKMGELRQRWAKRHDRIWDQKSELGLMPKRTKDKEVEGPDEGRERWEGNLAREEILRRAREENPLY